MEDPDSLLSNLRFPHWQREYEAVLKEADRKKLSQLMTAAENAIFFRLQTLPGNRDTQAERKAITNAVRTLWRLQVEKLNFPEWERRRSSQNGVPQEASRRSHAS
jgi:hypothetical protein